MSVQLTKEDWEKCNMIDDDDLILKVLKFSPKIDMMPFSGRNFYEFFEDMPMGKDAGLVYPIDGKLLAIYKYGTVGDSGYRMFGCNTNDALSLRRVIESGIGTMFTKDIGSAMLEMLDLLSKKNGYPTMKKSH